MRNEYFSMSTPPTLNFDALLAAILELENDGELVETKIHPEFPELLLCDYAREAGAHHPVWEDPFYGPIISLCRGLILNLELHDIAARPFTKFWSLAQRPIMLPTDEEPEILTKRDGSLAISFWRPDGRLGFATRGSFTSVMAQMASTLFPFQAEKVLKSDGSLYDLTLLFEVEGPQCGSHLALAREKPDTKPSLTLLGANRRSTGFGLPHSDLTYLARLLGVQVVEKHPLSFSEAVLKAESMDSSTEGFVAYWPSSNLRIKIKSPAWEAADSALVYASPSRVLDNWEHDTLESFFLTVPQEIQDLYAAKLRYWDELATGLRLMVNDEFWPLMASLDANGPLPDPERRKKFAISAGLRPSWMHGALFHLYDSKEPNWRSMAARMISDSNDPQ